VISPKLVEVGRHLNINIITNSEVQRIEGEPGNFTATITSRPRYIDSAACTGCGDCARHCPVTAVNPYNKNLDDRRATFIEYPQAVPLAFAIDPKVCIGCGLCENICLAKAVRYADRIKESALRVGAVILSSGSEGYDPSGLDYFGYGRSPNVVTSEEFERILSASGPYRGHVMRPLDREEPRRIAWIQCVGSRDTNRCGNGYCSSVCCMYAIKEAMIAKEHIHGDLDCTIFNMDIRTFGKDYEKYYLRARDKEGVQFVKARIHTVDPIAETGDLAVRYVEESGAIREEIFSMVVLSVGLQIPRASVALAGQLGIELNKYNFVASDPFLPVTTSRPGIYTCGVFQGPKDIPSSITEASAAACAAGRDLAAARGTETRSIEIPEEIDVSGETPRIGVFVCNCGINIGGIVKVQEVQDYAATLPHVVYTDQNLFTCSQDTQDKIKDKIKEHRLNRVVVAACTPKTHEPMFQETLQACGINKYLFEMANIRNQNSWIHSNDPPAATRKAKDLVRAAVARAGTLHPLEEKKISVIPRALVVGGGVAGMNAALGLANQGFEAVLVEKEEKLGGLANRLTHTIEGADVGAYVEGLIRQVSDHPKIQVQTQSLIVGFTGFKGNFSTEVLVGPGMYERKIAHGAVVLATGAREYQPKEYGYGDDPRVVTQLELGARLAEKGAGDLNEVVMIQCVGSRNEENPNCSRICCQSAIKNALHIKARKPRRQRLRPLPRYPHLRAAGGLLHRGAGQGRAIFPIRPRAPARGGARRGRCGGDLRGPHSGAPPPGKRRSAGAQRRHGGRRHRGTGVHHEARPQCGRLFHGGPRQAAAGGNGHRGIFVCGTAHSPKLLSETIAQAYAAASRATTFLSQSEMTLSAVVAQVEADKCASCLVCVRSCPYGVPRINAEGVI
jgi:heterodisulfide reductase subunit A2